MQCAGVGRPRPHITWRKMQGTFIAALERRLLQPENDNAFSIVNVKPQDAGKRIAQCAQLNLKAGFYTCRAENSAGTVSASAYLTVHYAPRVTAYAEEPISSRENETVVLQCPIDSEPPPVIRQEHVILTLPRPQIGTAAGSKRTPIDNSFFHCAHTANQDMQICFSSMTLP